MPQSSIYGFDMELKVVQFPPSKSRKFTLTEDEQRWLEAYMDTGVASQASLAIGIERNAALHGHRMRRRLSHFIEANIKALIGKCAPAALETIYELATDCPDPKVRLAAAQDLLNRAGFQSVNKHEISVADKSEKEIDDEINRLLQKGNIIDITGESE